MAEDRKISIAIPTYNRSDMTINAFLSVYDDKRVAEIVIVDDESDLGIFNKLKDVCDYLPKVKLYRNVTNQDCYRNKMTAISYCKNDWCCLLDSDNEFDTDYLDRIFEQEWEENTIYTPSFAKPTFDFRPYENLLITKENVAEYIDKPMFETMLNAANYFVNRKKYLEVWDGSTDPITSDSIFMCYSWLKAWNKIKVVSGLEYFHHIHDGSHYKNNVHRTPDGFHETILNNIRQLK